MPRTTTFIAAVAAALAVVVPTAAAEGQPTGTHSAEAANAVTQMLDARERSFAASRAAGPNPHWRQRLATAHSLRSPIVDDRFRIDPTAGSKPASTGADRNDAWPRVGAGLLIVIALGLGVYLIARPHRALAH